MFNTSHINIGLATCKFLKLLIFLTYKFKTYKLVFDSADCSSNMLSERTMSNAEWVNSFKGNPSLNVHI